MTKRIFIKKWVLANTIGLLIGYLLYTPIGHGFTGGHTHSLNENQLIAHCIALAAVALILFLFQKSVLRKFINIPSTKIAIATIAFIALFWLGYYQTIIPDGPDFDILFSYLVLGAGLWVGSISFAQNKFYWLVALLSFPIASFIGEVLFFLIVTGFKIELDMQKSMMHHTMFWLTVGVTTGLIGGWLSGLMLYKMLTRNNSLG